MRELVFKCPTTNREFSTGIELEEDSFKRLQDTLTKAQCPHCGRNHTRWTTEGHLDESISSDQFIRELDRAIPPPPVDGASFRFPRPWSIEENDAAYFVVRDADGQALAYVYFGGEPGTQKMSKRMTRDEARRMASTIADLPRFLRPRAIICDE